MIEADALRDALDWPHARTRRVDHIEEAMLAEAIHNGLQWVSLSRNKNWYSSAARRYLPRGFGYGPTIQAVDRLAALGFLEHDRKAPSSLRRFQSRFRASELLLAAIANQMPALRCHAPRSPVVLRNEHGQPVDYRDTAWTRAIARNVSTIEEMLASIRFGLDAEAPCLSRVGDYLTLENRKGEAYGIHLAHVPVARIFNHSTWEAGGRFCGPPYQSCPQAVRAHIQIDGEPTVEGDYGQTHVRLICARTGLDIPIDDLFDLPGFPRNRVKLMVYIALNALTLHSALLAYANHKPRRKGAYQEAAAILDAIKAKLPALAPYLHQGLGRELMRQESDIAETVMLRLCQQGIVSLPVHESFLVDARHVGHLDETMEAAWSQIVGPSKVPISHKEKPKVSAALQQKGITREVTAAAARFGGLRPGLPWGSWPGHLASRRS